MRYMVCRAPQRKGFGIYTFQSTDVTLQHQNTRRRTPLCHEAAWARSPLEKEIYEDGDPDARIAQRGLSSVMQGRAYRITALVQSLK